MNNSVSYSCKAILFVAILVLFVKTSTFGQYSFLVAGHAYGAHAGTNKGLHPPFLKKLPDFNTPNVFALFLTGDIVNNSTTESWAQVETELKQFDFEAYFSMGNHDANTIGYEIFKKKHGKAFYSFMHQTDCFIVLNSTESDRSISEEQLVFLKTTLEQLTSETKRVFVFFHEVIWDSDIRYKDVLSNSRSRYAQIKNVSNFWTEVYPLFSNLINKEFFVFAGDVGGNTDAISAFYDRRENVTHLASGMGEVADENFMKVDVLPDTVKFSLIPLNDSISMKPIEYYSIPLKPERIIGQQKVPTTNFVSEYTVSEVFNATSYNWLLPKGATGSSNTSSISISFTEEFEGGDLLVSAVNKGFGSSSPAVLPLVLQPTLIRDILESNKSAMVQYKVRNHDPILLFSAKMKVLAKLAFYDELGRRISDRTITVEKGQTVISLKEIVGTQYVAFIKVNIENETIVLRLQKH